VALGACVSGRKDSGKAASISARSQSKLRGEFVELRICCACRPAGDRVGARQGRVVDAKCRGEPQKRVQIDIAIERAQMRGMAFAGRKERPQTVAVDGDAARVLYSRQGGRRGVEDAL